MRPPAIAPEGYDRIVALYREHGSLVKVARELGISDRTLNRYRAENADLDQALAEARRDFLRARREAKPHGTRARYPWCTDGPDGGRCAKCKAANAEHQRNRNRTRRSRPPHQIPHGLGGYMNYGCKCSTCCAAKAAENRRYRNEMARQGIRLNAQGRVA